MKKKIFLDFDGTLTDSVRAYVTVYNHIFKANADYTKVNKWNLSDQCPLAVDKVEDIFASEVFFYFLELIDEDTLEALKLLKQQYNVTICSIGTPENISKKAIWIYENLDIQDMILLSQNEVTMDKSIIDMSGGIIIDDHEDNLFSSNAEIKICFGEVKEWNKNWKGLRALNWNGIKNLLIDKL